MKLGVGGGGERAKGREQVRWRPGESSRERGRPRGPRSPRRSPVTEVEEDNGVGDRQPSMPSL